MVAQSITQLERRAASLSRSITTLNLRFDELHLYIKRHYLVRWEPLNNLVIVELTPLFCESKKQSMTIYKDRQFEMLAHVTSTGDDSRYDQLSTPRFTAMIFAGTRWQDLTLRVQYIEGLAMGLDDDIMAGSSDGYYGGLNAQERLRALDEGVKGSRRLVKALWEDLQGLPLLYAL